MGTSESDLADVSQVIISYRLLPNASVDSFERWSREVDQPALLRQPAVRDYQVLRVDPSDDKTQPEFIEVIEVESRGAWDEARDTEEVQQLLKEWEAFCDPQSVRVAFARRL